MFGLGTNQSDNLKRAVRRWEDRVRAANAKVLEVEAQMS